jgi:hypothetical protein
MTFFVGYDGAIRLQRGGEKSITATIAPDDVNTVLNRLGVEDSLDNLITGDLLQISTNDPRGFLFLDSTIWNPDSETQFPDGAATRAYANVNAVGGVRLFPTFLDAVNNVRANEYDLAAFNGNPIECEIRLGDSRGNILGSVTSFELNTDRGAIETTSLSDKFREQYSAGVLSGSGSLECLFSYEAVASEETPLFLLQVINRIDIGSSFDALLSIASKQVSQFFNQQVFYELTAVVTRAGVTVSADALVSVSVDFVTTGSFKLRVGTPPEYMLLEDNEAIILDEPVGDDVSLDYLLQEVTD